MTLLFLGHTYEAYVPKGVSCRLNNREGTFLGNKYQMTRCTVASESTRKATLKYRGSTYEIAV